MSGLWSQADWSLNSELDAWGHLVMPQVPQLQNGIIILIPRAHESETR